MLKYQNWTEYFIKSLEFETESQKVIDQILKEANIRSMTRKKIISVLNDFEKFEDTVSKLESKTLQDRLKDFKTNYDIVFRNLQKLVGFEDFKNPVFKFIQKWFPQLDEFSQTEIESINEFLETYKTEMSSGKRIVESCLPKTLHKGNVLQCAEKICDAIQKNKLPRESLNYIKNENLKTIVENLLKFEL